MRSLIRTASVKETADELGLAYSTAKGHLGALYARIDVSDRSQAVAWLDDHVPGWRAGPT
jgi:DNA-binding CsgD family transcriptional regulator